MRTRRGWTRRGLALVAFAAVLLSSLPPSEVLAIGHGHAPTAVPVTGHAHHLAGIACADSACGEAATSPSSNPVPHASGGVGWFNVSSNLRFSPPHLTGAKVAYDPVDNYLVLFGGCDAVACPAPAQTWVYGGGAWTNLTDQSVQPPARSGADLAYDDYDGYLLLFGGASNNGRLLNDTWSFAGGIWTNRTATVAPSPRHDAALISDHADGEVVLFGGCSTICPLADTWRYAAGAWTNLTPTTGPPPPSRWGAAFTYDMADQYGLLVDGCGATVCPLNDTWTFSKNKWSSIGPPLPPKRFGAGLTYEAGPNATYLFGGNTSTHSRSDTWKFLAGKWSNVTTSLGTGPSGRAGAALLPTTDSWTDPGTNFPFGLLFGGTATGCLGCPSPSLGDTWVLEPFLSAVATALPVVAEAGQSVNLTAAVSGGTTPYQYAWSLGDGGSSSQPSVSHAFAQSGLYGPTVSVIDWAGVSTKAAVLVSIVEGPIVSGAASPAQVDAGQSVSFTGSGAGGTPPYAFSWSFGDGGAAGTPNAIHAYPRAGTFDANLTIVDAVQGLGTWEGTVVVNPPLEVSAEAASSLVVVGSPATLTATPIGGTPPFTVNWSFSDGTSTVGTVATHAFASAGSYNVQVTVTDGTGARAMQALTVVVSPVAPASSGPPGWLYPWVLGGLAAVTVAAAVGLTVIALGRRRRRKRRTAPAPLATAGVADDEWPDRPWSESPSSRRQNPHQRR